MTAETKQSIAESVFTENPDAFAFYTEKCRKSPTFMDWVADEVGRRAFDLWWEGEADQPTEADESEMVEMVLALAA